MVALQILNSVIPEILNAVSLVRWVHGHLRYYNYFRSMRFDRCCLPAKFGADIDSTTGSASTESRGEFPTI